MSQRFRDFQKAFPEEACLATLMRARHGGPTMTCAACGNSAAFAPRAKLRAYACGACNYLVYPGAGTPLEQRRTPLQLWFFALRLMAGEGGGKDSGRDRGKTASATLAREAAIAPVLAERIVREIEALRAQDRTGGSDWLDEIARSVAAAPANGTPEATAAKADRTAKPHRRDAFPRPDAPLPVAPVAAAVPPVADRVPRSQAALTIGLCAVAIVGLVAAAGLFIAWRRSEPAPAPLAEALAPALQAAARPTLILSSVESDLEAARQATQFALRSDPSLAAIQQQEASREDLPVPTSIQPPTNILLVPRRLPAGAPAAAPRQPPRPTAGSGDPEQILTFGPIRIRRHLVDTIVRAGRIVGADPTLLMAVADKESSFSTAVQAKTSSATGLYQFIEQTWLGVVSEFGTRHGMAAEARLIIKAGRQFTVPDPAERQRILDLRREPYISALLAAEMLKRDTLRLEKAMGRHLTGGEIYLIHFLGPDAAQTFISTMEETPGASAAELLPRPAQANRPIFYAEAGGETKTLSVSEVHKKFNDMIKLRLDRYGDVRKLWVQGAQK